MRILCSVARFCSCISTLCLLESADVILALEDDHNAIGRLDP